MTAPEAGWSEPSFFRGGDVAAPPLMTGADPMTGVFVTDLFDDPPEHSSRERPVQWGTTTYVGRPARRRSEPGSRTGQGGRHAAAGETPEPRRAGSAEQDAADAGGNRGLLAASRSMAVASLASRITGFLRSSMLVAAIGIHGVGDAYNVANNFPNMVYELLLGGVLSSVLVPVLVHAQERDEDEGFAYTQRLLSVATAALAVMTLAAVIAAPWIAGAFVSDPSQRHLTTMFATLLLPEIFFYGIGAMFMAVLNIRHSYAPGAWAPVLNNMVMIVTIAVFWAVPGPKSLTPATMTTTQLLVLGIGTTLGIAAQSLVLIPALRRTGFRWMWRFRARPNEAGRMREVGNLAGWVLGYVVASQIGVTVIARVGVHHGAYTVFTNADLLLQMPYGILVVSLLTALMPRLSRAAARGQTAAVIEDLSLGARLSAVALVPITVGLIVLGPALDVVLFAYGETSVSGARLIGTALAASAFGLFPFALVMLQLRVFYAMRDGRTPTLINIFMVGTKVVLVLVAAATLNGSAHIAEALTTATSASYVVGAIVGYRALRRRLGPLGLAAVLRTVSQVAVASVAGGVVALLTVVLAESALGTARLGSLVALVAGGVLGTLALGAVAWRLRIPEVQQIAALVRPR